MYRTGAKAVLFLASVSASALLWETPARAQSEPQAAARPRAVQEVIVTARKRQESILNVPVVETAVTQEQLSRLQTTEVRDLQKLVPGLVVGHAQGPLGTQVSIRGVGSISPDQGVDTSISLNIDGLSFSNGVPFESGLFDLGQIEVLKGPQALFYGKSSPGGVISLRTADPTDKFEAIGRASYDFEARTKRGEAIVSGPVTDTLKLRLAGMYSTSDGYFHNTAVAVPGTGALNPTQSRSPYFKEYIVRGTALWNPSPQFNARLKFTYNKNRMIFPQASQLKDCPNGPGFAPSGIPFIANDDCKLNRDVGLVWLDPKNWPNVVFNGVPETRDQLKYGTLEMNYTPIERVTITSTTGWFKIDQDTALNATETTGAGPAIGVDILYHRKDVTEELRANSDFNGPLNFTVGGFYQDGKLWNQVLLLGNTAYQLPPILSNVQEIVAIKTKSLFGQVRWNILPRLELAGGGRWTDETRRETVYSFATGAPVFVPLGVPRIHSTNFAPEVTLTYRPTDDVTLFGSYKRAFKSGAFSLGGVPGPGSDSSFGDEKVKGWEVGVKSRLLDRRLLLNLAAFRYRYAGLQVGAIEPTVGGLTITRTLNAGAARTYGVDFDAVYSPPAIEGLDLRVSVNWNKARYLVLDNIPCWGGQTVAAGCNELFNTAAGLFTAQNLSGTPMVRAPQWQSTFGFDYERPVGRDLTLVFSNSNSYSSKYVTFLAVGRPNNDQYQKSALKSDLSLALRGPDDRWEIALIGKNLQDKITAGTCNPSNFQNGALFGGEITGGTTAGPAGVDYVNCNSDPGREVWVRVQARY